MSLVSNKVRYALHGLAFLAHSGRGKPLPFDAILEYLRWYSQNLSLSPSYIAKVFHDIARAGFVVTLTGPKGGYRLSRDPSEVKVIEIVEALDGPLISGCCLLSVGDCKQQRICGVGEIIHEVELAHYKLLESHTLSSLAEKMVFPDQVGEQLVQLGSHRA